MSTSNQEIVPYGATGITQRNSETAAMAVAAQMEAQVKARYMLAYNNPRDWDLVRARILKECARPGFAEQARYRKPIGKGVEGLSIRFAEVALRYMGNAYSEVITVHDSEDKRIVRVVCTDLETNMTYNKDVTIQKTVERKNAIGREVLGSRTNSQGETTHTVRATEDELLNVENALISKALRTLALRLIPGDIQDEAEAAIIETVRNKAAKDPDTERKKIVDAFSAINIMPDKLRAYIGHDLNSLTPTEIADLRPLYSALKDGETNWGEVMDRKTATDQPKTEPKAKPANLSDAARLSKERRTQQTATKPSAFISAEQVRELVDAYEKGGVIDSFDADLKEFGAADADHITLEISQKMEARLADLSRTSEEL